MRVEVWSVVTAFLIAASGGESGAPAEDAGAQAYRRLCADCHGTRSIVDHLRTRHDRRALDVFLDDLLTRHHPPPEDLRQPIIRYLIDLCDRA